MSFIPAGQAAGPAAAPASASTATATATAVAASAASASPASASATGTALASAAGAVGGGAGCFTGSMGAPEQAAAVRGAALRRTRVASALFTGGAEGLNMSASYGLGRG